MKLGGNLNRAEIGRRLSDGLDGKSESLVKIWRDMDKGRDGNDENDGNDGDDEDDDDDDDDGDDEDDDDNDGDDDDDDDDDTGNMSPVQTRMLDSSTWMSRNTFML